jgi:hypothetical protein
MPALIRPPIPGSAALRALRGRASLRLGRMTATTWKRCVSTQAMGTVIASARKLAARGEKIRVDVERGTYVERAHKK